ncbi:MAG: M1 family aminopeptidase [Myxococcota bacterium]|nr:M1 family aminopeptidase [Myxococcota bacterium]
MSVRLAPMLLFWTSLALAAPDPGGPDVLAPNRDWDLQHLHLDLAIDPTEGSVEGTATFRVTPLTPGSETLSLHQRSLDIRAVHVDGARVDFRVSDHTVEFPVHRPETFAEVSIDYRATPRTGLHFRRPGRDSPDTYVEVWSQGEGTDNRYWFPSWDYPNDRFTSSGRFVVPKGLKVISNGLGSFDGEAWNSRLDQDLVNYLVMVAVGPYQENADLWRDREVRQWFPPDATLEEVENASGRVTEMLEFFSETTGLEYPYPVYTEVFVQRFLYTGMENTTATIEDRRLLHPDELIDTMRVAPAVVAHEAAHQWFGDVLTCRTWNELWLNEGFATFYEGLWMRESEGEAAFISMVRRRYRSALDRGPLAGRWWSKPDGHTGSNEAVYVKGASILQMLYVMFGEKAYTKAIQTYVQKHAHQLVETDDLRRAFEEVTGQHLQWFFDQWVHLPGSPTISVSPSWKEGVLTVTIEQEFDDTEDKPFFRLPIDLEIGTESDTIRRRIWMDEPQVQLQVDLEAPPLWVATDPDAGVLASFENSQSQDMWEAQLQSQSPNARFEAIHQLGEDNAQEPSVNALISLVRNEQEDIEYRLAALSALGSLSTTSGNETLGDVLTTADSARLRQRAAYALGGGNGAGNSQRVLSSALKRESNPHVRSTLLKALARHDSSAARSHASRLLNRKASYSDPEKETAARLLGEHGKLRDLKVLLANIDISQQRGTLHASAWAASHLVRRQDEGTTRDAAQRKVARKLEPLLESLDQRTRETAISVLGVMGDSQSAAILEAYARAEEVESTEESAKNAAHRIRKRDALEPSEDVEVENRLEELERRMKQLEEDAQEATKRH